MEFQIILLPRSDYWVWLRACRKYVLAFGAGMTDDPGSAARYMAPRQVVTLPTRRDGFPEIGDPVRWFQSHYPGIRLDLVDADTPEALKSELKRRVADNDRYGAKRRPFYLLWPTDYQVITQPFGANPQIYRRYGMPGHEGVDLRALTNTNVYACADGEVYEVHTNPRDHAYGIHVRVQHRDGYKTVYAHLARALVTKGDVVQAGALIGRADSTGNSSAAHLHLSLKRDGATARKETMYPKDIIDPTPFLVWPAQSGSHSKTTASAAWDGGRCLVGVRLPAGGELDSGDEAALRAGRAEAALIAQGTSDESVRRLRGVHPGLLIAARLEVASGTEDWSAASFLRAVETDVRRLSALGVRDFEVHSEPNLTSRGLGRRWADGEEFGAWFLTIVDRLKASFPEARFGFPMLSPGEGVAGQRQGAEPFLAQAEEALARADWLGTACYWTSTGGMDLPDEGRAYLWYRALFPDKLLWLTGLGPLDASITSTEAARQVTQFLERVREVPGIVAAFAGASTAGGDHEPLLWRNDAGDPTELALTLGRRAF